MVSTMWYLIRDEPMDFRQILTKLDDCRADGVSHFNSGYLAAELGRSKQEVSKYLSRLHGTGFLKRIKQSVLASHERESYAKRLLL